MKTTRALIVLVPGVHLQDLAGPVQVLYEARRYRLIHCGARPTVASAQGLTLANLAPLPPPQADDLVVVPGFESSLLDGRLPLPLDWLRRAHRAGARIASICSGAFALARAGLLDGRRCTTHWKLTDRLRREQPKACVLDDRLFVDDGRVVTSAGVTAGIDLMLWLVEADHGPLLAAQVAREMVVYLRRRGDDEQRSVYLDHRTHLHPGVHRVQDFLVQNPQARATAGELARIAGMSPRNLTRVFRRATGVTPHQFSSRVKLQLARDLLNDPQRTVDAIAGGIGFDDGRQLRRLFRQQYGVSIREFRDLARRAS
ncbi:MAG TPA: helix-turn-helix domain-containing protein [Myxococcales bacterium]|nr:helix-turn-helix domain-containing protein [Myxococcales bacterium]